MKKSLSGDIILFFVIWLVVGRFFTERLSITKGILKPFQFIDLAFVPFLFLLSLPHILKRKNDKEGVAFIVLVSFIWFSISAFVNFLFYNRFLIWAYILFMIDITLGPMFYISLKSHIRNPYKFSEKLLNLLYYLGFIEIVFFFFFNLPEFLKTRNPDLVTGTFGWNGYQFSVFLVIWDAVVISKMYLKKLKKTIAYLLLVWSLFTIYLVQFRAALIFYFAALGYLIYKLWGKGIKGSVKASILSSLLVLLFVGVYSSGKVPTLRWEEVLFILKYPKYILYTGKAQYAYNLLRMYEDNPLYLILGCGPGNHSSRAFDTFAGAGERFKINITGASKFAHILPLVPEEWRTDVSDKYTVDYRSLNRNMQWGSATVATPRASWISIPAEVGLIGLLLVLLLYYRVIRFGRYALKVFMKRKDVIGIIGYYVSMATTIYVFFLGSLNNWWETGRITILLWSLYWIVWARSISYRKGNIEWGKITK